MSLADEIREAHRTAAIARIEPPRSTPTNRASELGHPCLRYLVLRRTRGDEAKPVSPELAALFGEGEAHEEQIKLELHKYGIPIYGSQQSFPENAHLISGHVDGLIEYADHVVVLEIKSLNGQHYALVEEHDNGYSIRQHSAEFVRKWYAQVQLYLYLADSPLAIFVIKNKWYGGKKVIEVKPDLDYIETLVDRAEQVNRYVREGTEPPMTSDPALCQRCPFYRRACHGLEADHDAMLITSEEWLHELAERVGREQPTRSRTAAEYKRFREAMAVLTQGKDRVVACGTTIVSVKHSKSGTMRMEIL